VPESVSVLQTHSNGGQIAVKTKAFTILTSYETVVIPEKVILEPSTICDLDILVKSEA